MEASGIGNELLTMVSGGTNTVFTYDDWGRTVSKAMPGHLATYQYRYGDKLKKLTTDFPDESTAGYVYDGLGKRRIRNNGSTYTWWRWDVGWNVTAEYDDPDMDWDVENLAMTYIPGLAEIAGSDPSSGTYRYYSEDHLGSVRRMRDANKASLVVHFINTLTYYLDNLLLRAYPYSCSGEKGYAETKPISYSVEGR